MTDIKKENLAENTTNPQPLEDAQMAQVDGGFFNHAAEQPVAAQIPASGTLPTATQMPAGGDVPTATQLPATDRMPDPTAPTKGNAPIPSPPCRLI